MPEYRGYMIPKNKFPFWDKLIIEAGFVTHKRYKIIGVDEKRISIRAINGVTIKSGIIFSDIIINVLGDSIIAEGFTKRDAKEIRSLLGF